MMVQENQVNLLEQNQWEAGPGEELKIPEVYLNQLKFEIVVLGQKKEFTFRCSEYEWIEGAAYRFANVIIDTSETRKGEGGATIVELKRLTYHPEIHLVNTPFMAVPALEELVPGEAD